MGQCTSIHAVRPSENEVRAERETNNKTKTFHISLSLDQQSDHHPACIRLELADFEGQVSSLTVNENERQSPASVHSPNINHHGDIDFKTYPERERPEEQSGLQGSKATSDIHRNDNFHRLQSRRSAFHHRQGDSLRRLVTSDGGLMDPAKRARHPALNKENSWYHLKIGMDSANSLDLHDALDENNSSNHSTGSWGGLSLRKSIGVGWQENEPYSHFNHCNTMPNTNTMNDVSGNTVPDDQSETENDDAVDHQWEYRLKIREMTSDTPVTSIPTGSKFPNQDWSFHSYSFTIPTRSESCKHLRGGRTVQLIDTSASNSSSHHSCQSDPGFMRGQRRQTNQRRPLEPWNPHNLPAF